MPVADLGTLLRSLDPHVADGEFVFCGLLP